jgi:energy-coupling factor transporter ATP-binding protein EcfA2
LSLLIRDLSVFYSGSVEPALADFSHEFDEPGVTGLVGANGSGKSALAFVLAGLLPRVLGGSWKGDVLCQERALEARGWPPPITAAYTSQDDASHALLGIVADVLDSLPPDLKALARNLPLPDARTEVKHLSTGQRHAIDWLLCQSRRPTIIILDEGLSSMDATTAKALIAGSRLLDGNDRRFMFLIDQDFQRVSQYVDACVSLPARRREEGQPENLDVLLSLEGHISPPQTDLKPTLIRAWWSDSPGTEFHLKDFELRAGDCVQLAGRIGSGKSTLLKAMSGYPGPKGNPGAKAVRALFSPVYFGVGDHFVVAEATIEASLALVYGKEKARSLWPGLAGYLPGKSLDSDPGTLSFGQRRLLALAVIFGVARRTLALDEPDKGLDSRAQELLIHLISSFLHAGGTILLSSHNAGFVDRLRNVVPGLRTLFIF